MRFFLSILLLSSFVLEAAKPKVIKTSPGDIKIVSKIQKHYDGIKGFTADFLQKYHSKILRKDESNTGKIFFQKPGKMRWDYTGKKPKQFIIADNSMWFVKSQEKLAFFDPCFNQDALTASVAFIFGQGKILENFSVKSFKQPQMGKKGDIQLELLPKQKNSIYKKLLLIVDPKKYWVKQSVVVDLLGNLNQFTYTKLQFNRVLKKDTFAFKPPKGMRVTRINKTCKSKK